MQKPYHIPCDIQIMSACAAALLGFVVKEEVPGVELVGGGINVTGFYYDFIFPQAVPDSLIDYFDVKLKSLIKEEQEIRSVSMMRENAQSLLDHFKFPYLAAQASASPYNILPLLQIGEYYALCPAFDFENTAEIGITKLIGQTLEDLVVCDEEVSVTRITGAVRQNPQELKRYLKDLDLLSRKKDHQLVGAKMQLFSPSSLAGPIGYIWHSKGLQLKRNLQDFAAQMVTRPECEIATPAVLSLGRFKLPGYLNSFEFEGNDYKLNQALAVQHIDYLSQTEAKRVVECATVYRHYNLAERLGLLCSVSHSTRQTTIRCTPSEVVGELISSLLFIEQIITLLDFKGRWVLVVSGSGAKHKSVKSQTENTHSDWFKQALQQSQCIFPFSEEIEEIESGGVSLQFRVLDRIGREWTLSTVQVLSQNASDLGRSAVNVFDKGSFVVLNYCVWDSLDRLIGLMIEQTDGRLPVWLAPEQVRILAIGPAGVAYAQAVAEQMKKKKIRVALDLRSHALNLRIREAEEEKIPYLVLIGEEEAKKQRLSLRSADQPNRNQIIECELFIEKLYQESFSPRIEKSFN